MEKESVEAFWKDVAEKRGGDIVLYSFGRHLGKAGERAGDGVMGLLYIAGGKLWFESVEGSQKLFGFPMPEGWKKKYEPFELGIPLEDIAGADLVASGDVLACLNGQAPKPPFKPLGFLGSLFTRPVIQVMLRNGGFEFFDAIRDKDIVAAIRPRGSAA